MRIILITAALVAILAGWTVSAQKMFFGMNAPGSHFVDSVNGNDSNAGTAASPWKTVSHADAVLANNATLSLKYPDGAWVTAPPVWHGLRGLLVGVQGSDATKLYDVADNANTGTLNGAIWTPNGLFFASAGSMWVDLGIGTYGPGTADFSAVVTAWPTLWTTTQDIVSAGSLGGTLGWSMYSLATGDGGHNGLGTQIRNGSGTVASFEGTAMSNAAAHVFGMTVARGSASGLATYIDGVSQGTSSTVPVTGTLTSTSHTKWANTSGFFLDANWISQMMYFNRALSSGEVTALATWDGNTGHQATTGTGNYLLVGAAGGGTPDANIGISYSTDGVTFRKSRKTSYDKGVAWGVGNGAIYKAGVNNWWGTFEETNTSPTFKLAVAHSTNGFDWLSVTEIADCDGQGNIFIEPSDGSVHQICFTGAAVVDPTTVVEVHPTNAGWTTWSSAVQLLPNTNRPYNPVLVKIGSTYEIFYTIGTGATRFINRATASALTGPYTVDKTGDWMGIGAAESLSIVNIGGSNWRAYYIPLGGGGGIKYTASADDLETWAAAVSVTAVGGTIGVSRIP